MISFITSCGITILEKTHRTLVTPSQNAIDEKQIKEWVDALKDRNIEITVYIKNKGTYVVFKHSKNDFEIIKALVEVTNPKMILQSDSDTEEILIKEILND